MGLAELVLLAVGLSMDAFAVSICKGLGMKKINLKVTVVLGLFFGSFQAGMPVIGWALGSQFMGIIGPIDHWIAFILLALIGGNMIKESLETEEECYAFFQDLCTIAELRSMEQRYEVATLLSEGMVYSDILERTGASSATISRVNRALLNGTGGYVSVLGKMKEDGHEQL